MSNPIEDLLGDLLDATAKDLLKRVRSGEASPSDVRNAISLLKDNGITCEVRKGTPLDILSQELPDFDLEIGGFN